MATNKESAGDPAAPPGVQNLMSSFTRLSKALCGLLVAFFLLGAIAPPLKAYLALVPGKTLPCVWNVITAGYFEASFWMLLVDGGALLLVARHMEPIWGSKEFLQFVIMVNLSVGLVTFAWMMTVYFATGSETYLYGQVGGFHGVIAGFMVAIKQSMPEHEVRLLGLLKFRLKQLPFFVLMAVILFYLVTDYDLVTFCILGMFFSWVYLRFYQERTNGSKGDMSDGFTFTSFFPLLMQPVIDKVTTPIHKVFCPGHGMVAPYTLTAGPLPGSDMSEAQRRRERGARALEERLNKAAQETASADAESSV